MEKIQWKVEGMTCANCALTVNKFLKQQGAENVVVNPIDGDVSFDLASKKTPDQIAKGIQSLGYRVASENRPAQVKSGFLSNNKKRFWFCLPFTAVLMLHMIPGFESLLGHDVHQLLMIPWFQLALTLPVYIVGLLYFGKIRSFV